VEARPYREPPKLGQGVLDTRKEGGNLAGGKGWNEGGEHFNEEKPSNRLNGRSKKVL